MDSSESPPRAGSSLEATLDAWESCLARLEQQASQVLRAAKQLRKAAQDGALARAGQAQGALRDSAAKLTETIADADLPPIDIPAAFESGSFLTELSQAAAAAGVTLVQRDGRITAYPVVLRLEPRNQGVRIGRKLERRLRPSVLARHLKALQQRPTRFNARTFLDRLLRAYTVLAPQWRTGEGPLIALAELHDVLTLLPAAAADYPMEEFLIDLLRLDRDPDARSTRGHRFQLGGSTGTKGAKRLTVFDETGAQHDYYAVRFLAETLNA
ncbi:MAG: hypothetical protein ABSA58_00640 [Acetobacteraceae bacterium]|jgi:hypothetical protein